ncbi:MoaD/ThiS family protein [Noviherbaspirillum pedocola]|uniref:MoaD/ThiS family protein n=1 Tax=Noviherbaspirillum pedocola TaxID=2801341 RepID=A0A934SYU2_9BURK|nr:MoaD/ThiS family protein [Noviherbaspirillum pedocola]MBK4739050.1 MoaD/ThiS family protein [Noviherbaspirillum pedocola]
MKITLKLYATLGEYLPPNQKHNAVDIEVEPETRIADIVERFHLPVKLVHLVLVNGVYVAPEMRAQRGLQEGDVLAMWPPVAGG